jgi:hypothetical protein
MKAHTNFNETYSVKNLSPVFNEIFDNHQDMDKQTPTVETVYTFDSEAQA